MAFALAYPSVGHAQGDPDVVRFEAESSSATCDGVIESEHAGHSGDGYCNTDNTSGTAAQFTVDGAAAGQAVLEFGFANGSGSVRPAEVLVNGVSMASATFESTGAWTNWSVESVSVELRQGANTIRLAATGSAGLPNIDYMDSSNGGDQGGTPTVEPAVVNSFDTSAAGGGARPLIGDVSADGRLDLVMMQPHAIDDDRYEGALVAALTAYDIEGSLLWQAGRVDPNGANQGSDIPAQIHDIDGDGLNEVVAIMHPDGNTSAEGRFYIFDGQTGELERDFALPDPQAHDAIVFANLSGSATTPEILLKDRYSRAWAVDNNGEPLWSHEGNTGHYPWPYDFDGDGSEEIMIGYDMVDSDGDVLWTYDSGGHADTMWMADITGDGKVEIVLGGDAAIAFDAATGEQTWRQEGIVETQNIMVGDFIPELDGLESLGLDRIDRSDQGYDGLFLLDQNGEFVWQEERETRGCWGSIPEPIHNWTGDGGDLIMSWNRGCDEPTTIMNGSGDVISELNSAARLWHADFCGDDKEEVVEYIQGVSVTIKSNGECDIDAKVTGEPRPQTKRQYNNTRYTAGETPVN